MTRKTYYTIAGTIRGGLWWPMGEPAEKPVERAFTSGSGESLREQVENLMVRESGDFSDAPRLTADTVLLAERISPTGQRRVVRTFPLSRFPSVADYLTDEYSFGDWS
jgi:hypothetical protein